MTSLSRRSVFKAPALGKPQNKSLRTIKLADSCMDRRNVGVEGDWLATMLLRLTPLTCRRRLDDTGHQAGFLPVKEAMMTLGKSPETAGNCAHGQPAKQMKE